MKAFKSELVRKFAIYSLLALTLTGVGLSVIVSRHIVNDAIKSKIEIVQLALDSSVSVSQSKALKSRLAEKDREMTFLDNLDSNLRAIGVSDYSVWDRNNALVYSMMYRDGVPGTPSSDNALSVPSKAYDILNENASSENKLLRITLTLPEAESIGTYTVAAIFPYGEIQEHQSMLTKNIVLIIGSGLLLLYVLLLRVQINASKTLISQKERLDVQNHELERAYDQLNVSFHATIQALADAVDARDPYTAGHVTRVMDYSMQIGHSMCLEEHILDQLKLAAQMHDIGKIGISDSVLLKPDKLTDDEYEIIKSHPYIGTGILKNIPDFAGIIPAVRHHHERFDGRGYPAGLAGNDIPLESRIIAVADAYDAMMTNRPYRQSLSFDRALQELTRNQGTQFDPEIADHFIRILDHKQ